MQNDDESHIASPLWRSNSIPSNSEQLWFWLRTNFQSQWDTWIQETNWFYYIKRPFVKITITTICPLFTVQIESTHIKCIECLNLTNYANAYLNPRLIEHILSYKGSEDIEYFFICIPYFKVYEVGYVPLRFWGSLLGTHGWPLFYCAFTT